MQTNAAAKPQAIEHDPNYSKYVSLVGDGNVVETLSRQLDNSMSFLRTLSPEQANTRYAPDKWTIKEVIGHMLDSERIFAYRALRFARADQTALNGFEQDDYVQSGDFNKRELSDLLDEFENVRRANVHMFRGLSEDAWLRQGSANDAKVTVRALAYIMAGHELHHMNIIRTRYLAQ